MMVCILNINLNLRYEIFIIVKRKNLAIIIYGKLSVKWISFHVTYSVVEQKKIL